MSFTVFLDAEGESDIKGKDLFGEDKDELEVLVALGEESILGGIPKLVFIPEG